MHSNRGSFIHMQSIEGESGLDVLGASPTHVLAVWSIVIQVIDGPNSVWNILRLDKIYDLGVTCHRSAHQYRARPFEVLQRLTNGKLKCF